MGRRKLAAALSAVAVLLLGGVAHADGQAGQPHGKACQAHGKAGQHGQGATHGKAGQAHGKKCDPHGKAGQDHSSTDDEQESEPEDGGDD